jgi:hypothetical protein
LTRCDSEASSEHTPEGLRTAEAAGIRYFLETQGRQFKLTSRNFETEVLDVHCWCFAHVLLEQPSEIARTHSSTSGKGVDREIASDVVGKPGKQIAKRAVLAALCRKSGTELRLTARAPQKHDHHLGDLKGNRSA